MYDTWLYISSTGLVKDSQGKVRFHVYRTDGNFHFSPCGKVVCCQEVFKMWLKGPDATWGNLIKLLIDCEQTALAEQVEDVLGL